MLTRLIINNFKTFNHLDIELGNPVVFIGPNNSGKTTALQALALWELGLRRWMEKRSNKSTPKFRSGVTINRRDLVAVPVPSADLLWRDLHVRNVTNNGKKRTSNIRIDVLVHGVTNNKAWQCGLEFDYANSESFYCRPLRKDESKNPVRYELPESDIAKGIRVAFLPAMSGLAANETRIDTGAINVRLGQGRTAEVLRNLCYQIATSSDPDLQNEWSRIVNRLQELFRVELQSPKYIDERGEITMSYVDHRGISLDLSCAGRGLQQTLLLLAHMAVNPGAVLLLDEPDAHLEILRQRQIYSELTDAAKAHSNQIIAASHSEVILNEAADKDVVIAFVGTPHRIDDRGSQVAKALKEIGFDQFYQAEQTGWVLYVEGSTDLAILRAMAIKLNHPAKHLLNRLFMHPIGNQPRKGREHFFGLKEAIPTLKGVLVSDRDAPEVESAPPLAIHRWNRREIENYLCQPETLMAFASADADGAAATGTLFQAAMEPKRLSLMKTCIYDLVPPAAMRDKNDPWWTNIKASDEFLDRVFDQFYKGLSLPNLMRKSDYHKLAQFVPTELIDREIIQALDLICSAVPSETPENLT